MNWYTLASRQVSLDLKLDGLMDDNCVGNSIGSAQSGFSIYNIGLQQHSPTIIML